MPLINFKVDLQLTWNRNCVLCSANAAGNNTVTFTITDTKLYVPIVTLSTKDNTNLGKQLHDGFKRSIHWNKYQSKVFPEQRAVKTGITRFFLDAAFQGVNRLFVLAFNNSDQDETAGVDPPRNLAVNRVQRNSYRKYYAPRVDITNYKVLIDGRNFYDQPINDSFRKYDEIRKAAIGKEELSIKRH